MVYRNLVSTCTLNVYLTYACSACNAQNVTVYPIHSRKEVATVPFGKNEKLKMKMEEETKKAAVDFLSKIVEEQKEGKYRTAQYLCKCEKCDHTEPWASMPYQSLRKKLIAITVVLFFVFMFALMGFAPLALVPLIAGIAMWVAFFRYKKNLIAKMEQEAAALPEKSRPSLYLDVRAALDEAMRRSSAENSELVVDKTLQAIIKR